MFNQAAAEIKNAGVLNLNLQEPSNGDGELNSDKDKKEIEAVLGLNTIEEQTNTAENL